MYNIKIYIEKRSDAKIVSAPKRLRQNIGAELGLSRFICGELEVVLLSDFFDNICALLELSLNNPPIWMAVGYLEIIHVKRF